MSTTTKRRCPQHSSRLRAVSVALVAFLAGGLVSACDGLLDVELPTQVGGETLEDPALAQTLVNSLIGEFECAFSNYVAASGQLTDELRHSSAWLVMTIFDHRKITQDDDNRLCNQNIGYGVYTPVQKARFSAEDTKKRLEGWTDEQVENRTDKIAIATAYAGYARTILGEAFCEMAIDLGPLMTPAEVLQSAEQVFSEAISAAQTAGNADIENMALVGRARVRLNLGDNTGARADAASVPAGFVKDANYSASDPYRYNWVYKDNFIDAFISPSDEFVDAEFGGVLDSRVASNPAPIAGHDLTAIHWQLKYDDWTSPIHIASYEEAQLIIAEIDLGQNAVDIINTLHTAAALPMYVPNDVNDGAEILAHVLQERSRQLWLEGHRLNDFLRHGLPFATGTHPYDGVTYGNTTCLPLPRVEKNGNPNIGG